MMKKHIGPRWAWAIGLWLAFGIIGCEESSTEVSVMHPDTLFVVGLTCPDTAFITLPTDTVMVVVTDTLFVRDCPPGYHWHQHALRCHHDRHDHHDDDDDDDGGGG